jgi:hypothetical protein
VALRGSGGSALVIDRDAVTLADRRLLAHLAADEPEQNAALVCADYMRRMRVGGCRCRLVTAEDFHAAPFTCEHERHDLALADAGDDEPVDALGRSYRLQRVAGTMSIPELRWCRRSRGPAAGRPQSVSVREAIGGLEDYEPVLAITRRALSRARREHDVSTALLGAELARVLHSPIVLNRRLREVALQTIERQGLSLSEIAIRCGRIKRDRGGSESGETSWLARRLGLLPEGGKDTPTPWVHSDVLALIARRGLGVSPREAEPY